MHRAYDHRLKLAIIESENPNLFPQLQIPRNTAMEWIRNGIRDVVTIPEASYDGEHLLVNYQNLKNELEQVKAKFELSRTTFRMFGYQIQYQRLNSVEHKRQLVDTIKKFKQVISLEICLTVIGLSSARFHQWVKNLVSCNLNEIKVCARASLMKMTPTESNKINSLLSDPRFFHFSISSLAIYAKRQNLVHASSATWRRLAKLWRIRRERKRIYPAKPKIGIRAARPNELWHIDQTIIKIKCGTKVYIQSVVDNMSRMVLATKSTLDCGGVRTKELLLLAAQNARSLGLSENPILMSDNGSENINDDVKSVGLVLKDHLIAQIDIQFSNSMVESFFNKLKNSHLYFKNLDSIDRVEKEVEFFVSEHNNVVPLQRSPRGHALRDLHGFLG